jgi:hypothetical protein
LRERGPAGRKFEPRLTVVLTIKTAAGKSDHAKSRGAMRRTCYHDRSFGARMSEEITPAASQSSRLPVGIWVLGFVSLFMDISSEMIHGLLPLFLTSELGASTEIVGLIEGVVRRPPQSPSCSRAGSATSSANEKRSPWSAMGWVPFPSRCLRSRPPHRLCLRRGFQIASARVFAARRATQ